MTVARLREILLERGGLLSLITLMMYIWLAPPHVVDGDNAEFATLGMTGGTAHPPGYPLYIVWLRAMSWLPGASPAHTAAIATALLGGATVFALHAACRAWGARPLGATVAVAIFATGPVVLRVVTEAEVFALNNLIVASVLWLAAHRGPVRGTARAGLLGLLAGLGLGDQLTCVLVAPVGILGVIRAAREARAGTPVALAAAIGGLVLGLSSYAYLLVAADTPMSWGAVRDAERLLEMFLREDYGGPTAFRAVDAATTPWTNLVALASTLGRGWLWLPLAGGLAALAVGAIRAFGAEHEPRAGWVMLALAWLLAGPLLVLRFNVPPEGLGLYVNQRFHLMPMLLLGIPVAVGMSRVVRTPRALVAVLVSTLGVAGLAALSLPYVGRVHTPAVEVGARNMLHSLPPGAVMIHGQDELHAVTGYVQWALGRRQDVHVVTWPLMTLPWYRERIAARGITSGASAAPSQVQLVETLLARDVPVFVDRLQRDIIRTFPTHPYGVLIRVLPRHAKVPGVREVLAMNEEVYSRFALDYARPGPDDEFATEVHERYKAIWTMIGRMLEREGHPEEAARAYARATALGPKGHD